MNLRIVQGKEQTLAKRLGVTTHLSSLRVKAERLWASFPAAGSATLEDWLVDVANARGAQVVIRPQRGEARFIAPGLELFSNEELVACLCQLQNLDRPQILRLAAQLISAGTTSSPLLLQLAVRERTERVLAELARQALRVEPGHEHWLGIYRVFGEYPSFQSPLLHWTRLADPIPVNGLCDGHKWKLVA